MKETSFGIIRYTLTRYLVDNALMRCRGIARTPQLIRAIQRVGFRQWLDSESPESYLTASFDWLGIAPKDPLIEPGMPDAEWLEAIDRRPPTSEAYTQRVRPLSSRLWRRIRYLSFVRNGYRCQRCGTTSGAMGISLDVDHIKPRSTYPELTFDVDNTQILCRSCNTRKGTRETDYRRVQ